MADRPKVVIKTAIRRADDGTYTTQKYADKHPDKTITEHRKVLKTPK